MSLMILRPPLRPSATRTTASSEWNGAVRFGHNGGARPRPIGEFQVLHLSYEIVSRLITTSAARNPNAPLWHFR
jgi:hypothetical protein